MDRIDLKEKYQENAETKELELNDSYKYFYKDDATSIESVSGVNKAVQKNSMIMENSILHVTVSEMNATMTGMVSIVDLKGRVVLSQKISSKNMVVDLSSIATGVYISQLKVENMQIQSVKITR